MNARVRSLPADERGYVIPYVLALLVIALAFATAGLTESLASRSLTTRDGRVRRAQQAAESGIQRVLYEQGESNIDSWNLNGGPLQLSQTLDCMPLVLNASFQVTGLTTGYVNGAGICPGTSSGSGYTDDALGHHQHEQAEFIPGQTNPYSGAQRVYWPKIVALGWDDNGTNKVFAREELILKPIAPLQAIEGMGTVTLNGLSALGLNAAVAVNGDISSRGNLTLPALYAGVKLSTALSGQVNATIQAPSISGSLVSTVNGGTVSQSSIPLRPPVTISSSKADCPAGACPSVTGAINGDGYSGSAHTFTMTNASESVTFQPGDYVFCNFHVSAGTVSVNPSASAPVRVLIDNPNSSRCASNGLGSNQGNFAAATGVANLLEPANPTGTTTAPSGFQIYVVGDGGGYDNNTSVTIGDSATCTLKVLGVCTQLATPLTQAMVVYAPTSSVAVDTGVCAVKVGSTCTLGAAGVLDGAVIGDNVSVRASTITEDLDLGNYPLYNGVSVFRPAQYVECTPQPKDSSGTAYPQLQKDPAIDLNGC